MEKKKQLMDYVEKLKKSIAREIFVVREIENDKASLEHINTLDTLPENSKYTSLDEWKKSVNKQIARGTKTLENIAFKKIVLEAVENYVSTL